MGSKLSGGFGDLRPAIHPSVCPSISDFASPVLLISTLPLFFSLAIQVFRLFGTLSPRLITRAEMADATAV